MSYFIADDGAKIAYSDSGAGAGPVVLALAGLTRTGRDFDYLAPLLPPCRLVRMDYRGRGDSEWTGAASYTVPREAADALQLLDHLGLGKAAVLGTSRGGMIGMYLAAVAKARISGLCLNDIGPVIERAGLVRICDVVGRNPAARTFAELVEKLPAAMLGYEGVPASRWLEETERHNIETPQGVKNNYDPALSEAFNAAFDSGLTAAWPLFDACAGLPLALIRGANSDLLGRDTVAEMRRRRPDMLFAEVPGRPHIPFLDEPEAVALIRAWLGQIAA
jgi:pimeloyl-ACP methyl ester carboxylesterase